MASYHCSVKMLSRSSGRSAVQFAAYISATKMHDERLGLTFSHTSKEEVYSSEMLLSDRCPDEWHDPEKFWNEVEAQEKQSNSQVARTWEIALPHELTMEQNYELAKEFAQSLLDDGMPAVQFAIHQKQGNLHVHIMASTRDFKNGKWQSKEKKGYALDADGKKIPVLDENGNQKFRGRKGKGKEMLWERKTVKANIWNGREFIKVWRERVAEQQNAALEKYGFDVRVDHRSYKDQGIYKVPQIHEGYAARKMEQDGLTSERCQYNREVAEENSMLAEINRQIKELLEAMKRKGSELNERIHGIIHKRERSGGADRLKQLIRERERLSHPDDRVDAPAITSEDSGAREAADIAKRTEQLAERKQREAAEISRQREATLRRKQEIEAGKENTRSRYSIQRSGNSQSKEADHGFSR